MKILFLSYYFPPDLSAGSFRADALVDALMAASSDVQIHVVTTEPNRYSGHQPAVEQSSRDRLTVTRVPVAAHRSGMVDQALGYAPYVKTVRRVARRGDFDLVYATSSRLMTAVLGAAVAKGRAPLYLDIRDIFTDTMIDVLGTKHALIMPALKKLEQFAIRSAQKVNLVSSAFEPHFKKVDPSPKYRVFTNGIDPQFIRQVPDPPKRRAPRIVYAGNIGEGQGLHKIVPNAARKLAGRAIIRVIGDGGRKAELKRSVAGLDNVELVEPMSRVELQAEYEEASMLLMHLNDYRAFKKVLPSKLFEYGALERPILAGVAGHSRDFLRENMIGCEIFDPCDADGFVKAFDKLAQGPQRYDRSRFVARFARQAIMDEMAQDILAA